MFPFTKSNKRTGRQLSSWHGGDFSVKDCCSVTKAMHLCSECAHTPSHTHIYIKIEAIAKSCGTAVFYKPATTAVLTQQFHITTLRPHDGWLRVTRIRKTSHIETIMHAFTPLPSVQSFFCYKAQSTLPSNTDMFCLSSTDYKIPQRRSGAAGVMVLSGK